LITGGGARALPLEQVNNGTTIDVGRLYLAAMVPVPVPGLSNGAAMLWNARAKESSMPSPGSITAYAVNIIFRPPTVSLINPTSARVGQSVTIIGENFVKNMKVRFGSVDVAASPSTVYQVSAQIPQGVSPGSYNVAVVAGDVVSAPLSFTVSP